MNPKLKTLRAVLAHYEPACRQEEQDRIAMLKFMALNDDCLERTNMTAHFTSSAWIINEEGDKVLMVYHNIYDSWSWTGGHADGETDPAVTALKEAREETGIENFRFLKKEPVSLEIIPVDGHEKKGTYVSSHLHFNLTYLLEADEKATLSVKPDENSGVRWIDADSLAEHVSEPWMFERVYRKLLKLHVPCGRNLHN